MGARGPKPGWKTRTAQQKGPDVALSSKRARKGKPAAEAKPPVVVAEPTIAPLPEIVCDLAMLPRMQSAHRENPAKLGGEALRHLAHQRGIARSASAAMTDEKLREQLKYLAYRQYEEA